MAGDLEIDLILKNGFQNTKAESNNVAFHVKYTTFETAPFS